MIHLDDNQWTQMGSHRGKEASQLSMMDVQVESPRYFDPPSKRKRSSSLELGSGKSHKRMRFNKKVVGTINDWVETLPLPSNATVELPTVGDCRVIHAEVKPNLDH